MPFAGTKRSGVEDVAGGELAAIGVVDAVSAFCAGADEPLGASALDTGPEAPAAASLSVCDPNTEPESREYNCERV